MFIQQIALLLTGLANADQGRRTRTAAAAPPARSPPLAQQLRPLAAIESAPGSGAFNPLKSFATFLLAQNAAVAYSPGWRSSAGHVGSMSVVPDSSARTSALLGRRVLASWKPQTADTPPSLRAAAVVRMITTTTSENVALDDVASSSSAFYRWVIRNRSYLLLVTLIFHKCALDGLTRYTRVAGTYSGSTVATMSEIGKFPLIMLAIALLGDGPRQVVPIFREAFSSKLFSNAWISLCYTFNNLLYFDALSALSAVAYQVLSQSKTLFTAGLMYFMVGKRLILKQVVAIALLIGGSLLVQLQELSRSDACMQAACAAAAGPFGLSPVTWGAIIVLFSSFISALPNVAYERVLKTEGENQWVNNIQVTVWIMLWIGAANYVLPILKSCIGMGDAAAALTLPAPNLATAAVTSLPEKLSAAFMGFTPAVWGVVFLQSLKGIILPATLKYADNILYAFAKPGSIVVTTILSCMIAGMAPSLSLVLGVSTVVASMFLYSSKPASKQA